MPVICQVVIDIFREFCLHELIFISSEIRVQKKRTRIVMRVRGDLAGIAGFEPADDGVKVRCLTPWLYPKILAALRKKQRRAASA